jgi:hypothetical protein
LSTPIHCHIVHGLCMVGVRRLGKSIKQRVQTSLMTTFRAVLPRLQSGEYLSEYLQRLCIIVSPRGLVSIKSLPLIFRLTFQNILHVKLQPLPRPHPNTFDQPLSTSDSCTTTFHTQSTCKLFAKTNQPQSCSSLPRLLQSLLCPQPQVIPFRVSCF